MFSSVLPTKKTKTPAVKFLELNFRNIFFTAAFFLPARPGSQTHASHKGRMILNHESPAGCIKIVAKSLHLVFATFVLSVVFFNLRIVS